MKLAQLSVLVCGIMFSHLSLDCMGQTDVTGVVIDRGGKPIQGVRCIVSGFPMPSEGHIHYSGEPVFHFTDKEGRFSIPLPRSDPLVDLQFDGRSYAPAFLYKVRPADSPLRVVMTAGKVLRGRIVERVNDQVVPIAHAEVELQMSQEGFWYQNRQVTDDKGEFQFRISEPPQNFPWMLYYAGKRFAIEYAQIAPDTVILLEASFKLTSNAESSAPANGASPRR
jgi:hypothetical protein